MLSTTKSVVASQTTLPVFYSIWANYTSSPSAAFPDYLLLSYAGVPSGISYKKAALLWNCTSSLSFCNTDGAQTWAYAANGATTYQQLLITETGLTTSQFALVLTWLGSYWSNQVEDYLFTEYGIATISDLGFVQWGIGTCLGSVSVSDVQDIAITPEDRRAPRGRAHRARWWLLRACRRRRWTLRLWARSPGLRDRGLRRAVRDDDGATASS